MVLVYFLLDLLNLRVEYRVQFEYLKHLTDEQLEKYCHPGIDRFQLDYKLYEDVLLVMN